MSAQDFSRDLRSLISIAESLQSIGSDDAERFIKFCNDLNTCILQGNAIQVIESLYAELPFQGIPDKLSDFSKKYQLLNKLQGLLKDFDQSQNAIGNILSAIQCASQNPVTADSLKQIADRLEQIGNSGNADAPPPPQPDSADEQDSKNDDADVLPNELDMHEFMIKRNHGKNKILKFTKPLSCIYKGDKKNFSNWKGLNRYLMSVLCKAYPSVFDDLGNGNKYAFVSKNSPKSDFHERIGKSGFFVNFNLSADDTVANIITVLNECNIDYNDVVITYRYTSHRPRKRSRKS